MHHERITQDTLVGVDASEIVRRCENNALNAMKDGVFHLRVATQQKAWVLHNVYVTFE